MIFREASSFASVLPHKGALMGFDVGSTTIGLALCDSGWKIASPFQTIQRTKFSKDILILKKIFQEYQIIGGVVGWPLNMNGTEGPRCQSVHQFCENILKSISLPLLLWDERLSTMAVTRVMLDADLSRKRRDVLVDKLAASYILQGAVDCLSRNQKVED